MQAAYWIVHEASTKLAIVPRPRGGDWLEDDLRALQREGTDIVVSLLTTAEEEELGLIDEGKVCERIGMRFYNFPIPDRTTPQDSSGFRQFTQELSSMVIRGQAIGIHCRGSIGRATLTAAGILICQGWKAKSALQAIEAARGCPVPDTEEQRQWIENLP